MFTVRVTEFQAEQGLGFALPISRTHPGIRTQLVNWGVRVSWVVIKIRITTGSEPSEGEISGNLRIRVSRAGWERDQSNQGLELGGIKTGRQLGNQSGSESRLDGLGPGRVEMVEGVTRG